MKGDLIKRLIEEAERESKSIMGLPPQAKALCKEAAEKLEDLDKKLDQAIDLLELKEPETEKHTKHPKCLGEKDYWGDFDCGYQTVLMCEDCRYGLGGKDPEAKCNQI